ncbi:MAG: hypothetical protein M0017_00555 [Desulfobacteraceae bacterium]|nr:hypothetical protein [Desulfobacteraceae bacterium]
MKKVKLWAALAVLFFSGIAIGVSGAWIYWEHSTLGYLCGRGPHPEKVVLRKLSRDLDLNDVQKKDVERVLCQTHSELMALRNRYRPEKRRIIEQSAATIRAGLSADQQKKFDVLLAKIRAFEAKKEASLHRDDGHPSMSSN